MGSEQSLEPASHFNLNDWTELYQEAGTRTLSHRFNPSLLLEEHPLTVATQRDLELTE